MPNKPNFLIIGAPKCGSTTLWHELRKHPDVFMSEEKEPHFFSHNFDASRNWENYQLLFEGAGDRKAVGEASTSYSHVTLYPETPERIARCLPRARLIYTVRHPIRRIESAWRQNVVKRRIPPDTFKDAVQQYSRIVSGSLYYSCIQAYRRHFSDDQILVVFLEDLSRQPKHVLNQCFEFLGVEPIAEDLDRSSPQNTSREKKIDTPILMQVRGSAAWEVSRRLIPEPAKKAIHGWFGRPLPEPAWDIETKRWAIRQVRDEAKNILKYAGKPEHFWTFDSPKIST